MSRSQSIIEESTVCSEFLVEKTHIGILVFCDTLERTGILLCQLKDGLR